MSIQQSEPETLLLGQNDNMISYSRAEVPETAISPSLERCLTTTTPFFERTNGNPYSPSIRDFTVNVTQGPLAGQSYSGTFSYDDSTLEGTGVETLDVDQDLSVCMNYFGRNYTEVNDTSYPEFPKLMFDDGTITQLDFWVQPNQRVNWWGLLGWEVNLSERPANAGVPDCQGQ